MEDFVYLSELIIFTTDDVVRYKGNKSTAYSLLRRLQKKDSIRKIRNNLYSCVNPATNSIYASKFQIASSISETSFVSHASAMGFFGMNNQVSYSMYVSSLTKFNNFEFEGIRYEYQQTKTEMLVTSPKYVDKVRISEVERSIIDSIKEMDRITGLEEVLENISLSRVLNEKKLISYLDYHNSKSLYKRVGYLLSLFRLQTKLPLSFFEYCKMKSTNTTVYLTQEAKGSGYFDKDWNLIIPNNMRQYIGEPEL